MTPLNSQDKYSKSQHGKSHRYVKVSESIHDLDNLPVGAHLIVVHPGGGRSYRCQIDPDKAAVQMCDITALLEQIKYEQDRNQNNVAMADMRIKELEQALEFIADPDRFDLKIVQDYARTTLGRG